MNTESDEPRGGGIAQLRKGVAPYCALALMAGRARYGYDLARELAAAGVVAGAGSVYPLLARMDEDGWVHSEWRQVDGAVPRKYYGLSPKGQAALDGFRVLWPQFVAEIGAILTPGRAAGGGEGDGRDGG